MEVCFLCFKSSNKSGSGMDTYTWNIVSRPTEGLQFTTVSHSRNSLLDWIIKDFLIPIDSFRLLSKKADAYHAVSPVATKIAVLARKSPIITTVHDLIPNSLSETTNYYKIHPKKRRWLNPWYWWFLKRSDYYIATSEKNRQDLINILKVKPERISVVFYGTDRHSLRVSHRTDYHNPKNILYLGALDPGKGIYDVVQAFKTVSKRLENVNLLIGGQGGILPKVKRFVAELGLKDNVKFLGFVPQSRLSYYYELSDIFTFPSYYGFHLMFLDAMSYGLPIVAYDAGYGREYLGDAGLLTKPGEVEQLAENMINILTNKEEYVDKSKKALERAKLFTWERMAQETMNVYKNIVVERAQNG